MWLLLLCCILVAGVHRGLSSFVYSATIFSLILIVFGAKIRGRLPLLVHLLMHLDSCCCRCRVHHRRRFLHGSLILLLIYHLGALRGHESDGSDDCSRRIRSSCERLEICLCRVHLLLLRLSTAAILGRRFHLI